MNQYICDRTTRWVLVGEIIYTTASHKTKRTKRYSEEAWKAGGTSQTQGSLNKRSCHLPEETDEQLLCVASDGVQYTAETLTKQSHTRTEEPTSGSVIGHKS